MIKKSLTALKGINIQKTTLIENLNFIFQAQVVNIIIS